MYEVKNLSFSYKNKENILNNVSFTLKTNKINAIVGVNGAGKTTLFDCMTDILDSNENIKNLPPLNEILYQTQSLFFSPAIKTKDFVNFIRRLDKKKGIKTKKELSVEHPGEEFERIKELWDIQLGTLSVGERKWLFMVMLSELDKSLYIFDEPMSGVDPSSRLKMTKRMEYLIKDKNKTCVISTHQLHELISMNCHIIVLHNGSIKYQGDFQEWLNTHNTTNPDQAFEDTISN